MEGGTQRQREKSFMFDKRLGRRDSDMSNLPRKCRPNDCVLWNNNGRRDSLYLWLVNAYRSSNVFDYKITKSRRKHVILILYNTISNG